MLSINFYKLLRSIIAWHRFLSTMSFKHIIKTKICWKICGFVHILSSYPRLLILKILFDLPDKSHNLWKFFLLSGCLLVHEKVLNHETSLLLESPKHCVIRWNTVKYASFGNFDNITDRRWVLFLDRSIKVNSRRFNANGTYVLHANQP